MISQGATNYLSTITIDLGSEHGIAAGMPVVTERGLVGRIHKVGPTTATVLLITDPSQRRAGAGAAEPRRWAW